MFSTDLHLHRLAIDEFNAGDEVVEDDSTLGAGVQHDAVDLAAHSESRVAASVHVHHIVHIRILYHQVGVALLVFLVKNI